MSGNSGAANELMSSGKTKVAPWAHMTTTGTAEDQHELAEQESDDVTKVNQEADDEFAKRAIAPIAPLTSSPRRLSAWIEETLIANVKKGDKVTWRTSQGETEGRVVKKQTSDTKIKGHTVKASKDDPQIIVESDKSGKKAAHKPSALKKA